MYRPLGYFGTSIVVVCGDGLIVYDMGVNVDAADVASGDIATYAGENFEVERANEFDEIMVRQGMGIAYYGGVFLPPEDNHHRGIGLIPTGGAGGFTPRPITSVRIPN